jgi:predicted Zn-dependent peptidase
VVAGNVQADEIKTLAEKWFGPIPAGRKTNRSLPFEPVQTEPRKLVVNRDVPSDAIHKVYHMGRREDPDYQTVDLLSDILGRGHSSRLYNALVKDQQLFTEISAYVTGNSDPGLFVISGKLKTHVLAEAADLAIQAELNAIIDEGVDPQELQKVKNKAESSHVFGEVGVLNKAMNLAFSELLGDAGLVNTEIERIQQVTADGIKAAAARIFKETNSSTLYYLRNQ